MAARVRDDDRVDVPGARTARARAARRRAPPADSRVRAGDDSMVRYSGGIAANAARSCSLSTRLFKASSGCSARAALNSSDGFRHIPLRFVNLPEEHVGARFVGLERHCPRRMIERRIQASGAPFDVGELAVQEGAVGRSFERADVRAARVVQLAGLRQPARGLDLLLLAAEPQHVDAGAQHRQRRIGLERGVEALQRLLLLPQCQQRLGAATERRRVSRVDHHRAIEVQQRILLLLVRQRHVAEPDFRRIERRRLLERGGEVPLGRAKISGLQPAPTRHVALDRGRRSHAAGHAGHDVIRVSGCRDGRRGWRQLGCAARRRNEQAHPDRAPHHASTLTSSNRVRSRRGRSTSSDTASSEVT